MLHCHLVLDRNLDYVFTNYDNVYVYMTDNDNLLCILYNSSNKKNLPYIIFGIFCREMMKKKVLTQVVIRREGEVLLGDEEEGLRKGITQTYSFSKRFILKIRSSYRASMCAPQKFQICVSF